MLKRFFIIALVIFVGVNLAEAQQIRPQTCDPYGIGQTDVHISSLDLTAPAEGTTAQVMDKITINPDVLTALGANVGDADRNIADFANPATNLEAAHWAHVTADGNQLQIFEGVCTDALVLAELETGSRVTVLDGPIASEGFAWWRVRRNDVTGWVREGDGSEIWLQGA